MSKLKNNRSGIFNLDISEVHEIDNVRKEYKNIPELASSIKKYGQQQSCGVDKDNNIIWGHRRFRAVEQLVKDGESFQLKCVQAQGDRKAMQMIENLHRDDLTAEEKENGVADMVDELGSQKEVAVALCLPKSKISDIMNAHDIRLKAFDIGEDTSKLSTSAVNAFRTVNPEKLSEAIKKTVENGGTVKAAQEAVKDLTESFSGVGIKSEDVQLPKIENDLYDGEKDFPEEEMTVEKFIGFATTHRMEVECYRKCRNKISGYCTADKIMIDSFGMCNNFKEV